MTATTYRHPAPVIRGQYQLVNPDTGEIAKLQRVTNRIGILADRSGLNKWLNRTAMAGLAARPDLILQVNQAAQAEDNRRLDALAETAREAGGGNSAAAMGTALHSVFEQFNLDGTRPTDPTAAMWLDGVIAALDNAGFVIDPNWVEQVVCNFDLGYAGQIDGAVSLEGEADTFLIDLKTGKDVRYGLNEYALQLATYAHATHYWDSDTNICEPIKSGDLNWDAGFIIHAPVDLTQGVTIYELDLTAAIPALELIDHIKTWRKTKVGAPMKLPTKPVTAGAAVAPPATAPAVTPPDWSTLMTKGEWCTFALTSLIEARHGGTVAADWPPGLPTPKQARTEGIELTDDQYDVMHRLLMDIASKVGHPFFPQAYPDNDAFVPAVDPRIITLKEHIVLLPADLIERLQQLAADHGIPKLTSGQARRSDIDMMEGWVEELSAEHKARRDLASAHLGTFPDAIQQRALEAAGITEPQRLTHQATERLGVLADAFELGIIVQDDRSLVAAPTAFTDLVARYGGSKKAVIDAAKDAASHLGLARPTSSTVVQTSLMLLSATSMQATPTNTNTGDK
jgi:hypothetical protein